MEELGNFQIMLIGILPVGIIEHFLDSSQVVSKYSCEYDSKYTF